MYWLKMASNLPNENHYFVAFYLTKILQLENAFGPNKPPAKTMESTSLTRDNKSKAYVRLHFLKDNSSNQRVFYNIDMRTVMPLLKPMDHSSNEYSPIQYRKRCESIWTATNQNKAYPIFKMVYNKFKYGLEPRYEEFYHWTICNLAGNEKIQLRYLETVKDGVVDH